MAKTRVLIVDDSVAVRHGLGKLFATEADFEVVGTAADGRIALAKMEQVLPDVVILDVEMPEMDGLETLAAIRQVDQRLPVIMFSSLTERGAPATLEALALGASDYVTKPSGKGGPEGAIEELRRELLPKLRAICQPKDGVPASARGGVFRAPRPATEARRDERADVVVIGVSTGGPNALSTVIPALPGDLPVCVLIVQHMPASFVGPLADRLASKSAVAVRVAVEGEEIARRTVLIAPGDRHLSLKRESNSIRVRLDDGPPENSCRPAADVLFRSAAEAFRAHALAVVLTGMGKDGLSGSERIREAGGHVVVQDEATSVIWGMPGQVAMAGLADRVLPLDKIAAEIARRCSLSRPIV